MECQQILDKGSDTVFYAARRREYSYLNSESTTDLLTEGHKALASMTIVLPQAKQKGSVEHDYTRYCQPNAGYGLILGFGKLVGYLSKLRISVIYLGILCSKRVTSCHCYTMKECCVFTNTDCYQLAQGTISVLVGTRSQHVLGKSLLLTMSEGAGNSTA